MIKKGLIIFVLLISILLPVYSGIRVITDNYPPYNYIEKGEVVGFSTAIVKEVLKRSNIDYERIEVKPWPRAYLISLKNDNVLIYSIAKTKRREDLFKWVGIIAPYKLYLFKMKSRDEISINSLMDAKEYKIGVVPKDVRAQYFLQHGFNKNIENVANDSLNVKKLYNGRIDLVPNEELSMMFRIKKLGFNPKKVEKAYYLKDLSTNLYMAFSNGTSDEIINRCKRALKEIKNDGTYEKIWDSLIKK